MGRKKILLFLWGFCFHPTGVWLHASIWQQQPYTDPECLSLILFFSNLELLIWNKKKLTLFSSKSTWAGAYLSSFWKPWSPRSRSLKRKRGGSGGTSLSCCSILRAEMSRTTPLWLLWGAEEELEEGQGKGKEEVKGGERVCPCVCVCVSDGCKIKK